MATIPDFQNLITLELLEENCKGAEQACTFPYQGYMVVGHKCEERNLWEVHIHKNQTQVMFFTVQIFKAKAIAPSESN